MSLGALWRFGVWHPFPNPHFRRPQRLVTTVASLFTSGATITTNTSDITFLASLRPGDIIRAISSYSGHAGVELYAIVVSVGSTSFTISTPATFVPLAVGDTIICWTTKVPEGYTNYNNSNWSSFGIVQDNILYPFDNHYALKISAQNQALESSLVCAARKPLLVNTAYYCAVVYKAFSIGNCRVFVYRNTQATLMFVSLAANSNWVEASASATTGLEYVGAPLINIYRSAGNDSLIVLKTIVVMHAAETSAEASGVYTLPKFPEAFRFTIGDGMKSTELIEDQSYMKIGLRRSGLLNLSADFVNVPQAVLDDLVALQDWQAQGNLICLEPSLHSIPKWMIGSMEVRDISRKMLTNEVSFTLVFEELI